MKIIIIFLVVLIPFILSSCGNQNESPLDAAIKMKFQACRGDVEGFYNFIDKKKIERQLYDMILESYRDKHSNNMNEDKLAELREIIFPSIMVLKWELINKDIALGENSIYCNGQYSESTYDISAVDLEFPDDSKSTWGFEESSGQLYLVSIMDEAPFDFVDLDLNLKATSKRPVDVGSQLEDSDKTPMTIDEAVVKNDIDPSTSSADLTLETELEELTKENDSENQTAVRTDSNGIEINNRDFGNARWGMTKEQVRLSQHSNPESESGNTLVYNGSYNGMSAKLNFVFNDNSLSSGSYKFLNIGSDANFFVSEYSKIKETLSSQYGQPATDEEIWINPTYKGRPERYGFAVYIGHLRYKSTWITDRSYINLELDSADYGMVLRAVYNSL